MKTIIIVKGLFSYLCWIDNLNTIRMSAAGFDSGIYTQVLKSNLYQLVICIESVICDGMRLVLKITVYN